ncbi:hypothetical protein N9N67_09700 [Bacteriovoracaceae bacterium]|nr:hypothetical protein [Bacteriovoracaceae bacterium]
MILKKIVLNLLIISTTLSIAEHRITTENIVIEESICTVENSLFDFNNAQELKEAESCRFFYSLRWGWVDLKHFGGIAKLLADNTIANKSDFKFYYALLAGEAHEQFYELEDPENTSTYSYEDLISNFLGASFQLMFNRGFFNEDSYLDALKRYFSEIEISGQPMEDFLEHSGDKPLSDYSELQNKNYIPVLNSKSSAAINNPTQAYLNYLRSNALIFISSNRTSRELMVKLLEQASSSLTKELIEFDKNQRTN